MALMAHVAVWFVGIASLISLSMPAAAFTRAEVQCRLKAATAYRIYGRDYATRAVRCHLKRMLGKYPPAVDCDDPATWLANGLEREVTGLAHARQRLRFAVNSCNPGIVAPASLGYTTCPAPCAAGSIDTFDDLADCLLCLTDGCLTGAVESIAGLPPLPIEKTPRKCQERVGRELVTYYNKRSLNEHVCQLRQELGKQDYVGIDCTDFTNPLHPLARRIERTRAKLDKLVARRCADVDIGAQLDSCGTDVPSEQACLKANVEQCTALLFEVAYP